MTIQDLVERLQKYPADSQVMILDGFNGGGEPRQINLGPTQQVITSENAKDGADCEGLIGKRVVIVGYGCY